MRIDVITLFPGMFEGPLTESILQRAREKELLDLLLAANRDDGTAFLLVSHNPPLLKSLCRRILVLEEGRIVRERTV